MRPAQLDIDRSGTQGCLSNPPISIFCTAMSICRLACHFTIFLIDLAELMVLTIGKIEVSDI